jgi:hypothetical protein
MKEPSAVEKIDYSKYNIEELLLTSVSDLQLRPLKNMAY